MGDGEYGKCDMCGKESTLNRKYYHYDIDCECCMSPDKRHFQIVRYCESCTPKPPHRISVSMRPSWG